MRVYCVYVCACLCICVYVCMYERKWINNFEASNVVIEFCSEIIPVGLIFATELSAMTKMEIMFKDKYLL